MLSTRHAMHDFSMFFTEITTAFEHTQPIISNEYFLRALGVATATRAISKDEGPVLPFKAAQELIRWQAHLIKTSTQLIEIRRALVGR